MSLLKNVNWMPQNKPKKVDDLSKPDIKDPAKPLTRGKLTECIFRPADGFLLKDGSLMQYNNLHDPHLRYYFSQPKRKQNLRKLGLITKQDEVPCSIKDAKQYVRYRMAVQETRKNSVVQDQTSKIERMKVENFEKKSASTASSQPLIKDTSVKSVSSNKTINKNVSKSKSVSTASPEPATEGKSVESMSRDKKINLDVRKVKSVTAASANPLTRGKLGQSIFRPADGFLLNDSSFMQYNNLHDPHLRYYFSQPKRKQNLRKLGLITKQDEVLCSIKEAKQYVRYRLAVQETRRKKSG